MKFPKWVSDPTCTSEEVLANRLRFSLRLASCIHNPRASLKELSEATGYSCNYLQSALDKNHLNQRARLAICGVIGVDVFNLESDDDL